MFHCPEASFPKNDYRFPLFSVAMNSKLTLSTNSTVRMSSIEKGRPSDTVVFLDNLLEGERKVDALQAKTELGQPSAYASRFVVRHPGGGVMAFGGREAWVAFAVTWGINRARGNVRNSWNSSFPVVREGL